MGDHHPSRAQHHHLDTPRPEPALESSFAGWCDTGRVNDLFGWDEVAAAYADRFNHELDAKPFDRKILDWFIERAGPVGPICDLGCGPGQVAAYVHSLGYQACGIDLSPAMVQHATRLNPDIAFEVGDMCDLADVATGAFGGIASFYSIVNLPASDHARAFNEIHRVLRPGGWLLLSFHIGEGVNHVEEFLGEQVRLDFHFFRPEDVQGQLEAAGLQVIETMQRRPYPESVEAQTDRAYIFATRFHSRPCRTP